MDLFFVQLQLQFQAEGRWDGQKMQMERTPRCRHPQCNTDWHDLEGQAKFVRNAVGREKA